MTLWRLEGGANRSKPGRRWIRACGWSFLLGVFLPFGVLRAERRVVPLDGKWQFRRDEPKSRWKVVELPASFEQHEGSNFDGVGIYRRMLPPVEVPSGGRVLLHFSAVATHTEVWCDGKPVGEHLGGWTPFRFDVTDRVVAKPPGAGELRVRVDERVGHDSQGFLPVIAPHFGGMWQRPLLLLTTPAYIDDLSLLAVGEPETGTIRVAMRVLGPQAGEVRHVTVRHRRVGTHPWSDSIKFDVAPDAAGQLELRVPISGWDYWWPESPRLYELQLSLYDDPPAGFQPLLVRAAFRTFRTDGQRFLLNGRPISLRGLLNWGYAPPRVAPAIDESSFRRELKLDRSYGFNLMKFCLWVPPKRYLEMADEVGMLAWIEYPTWHSRWTPDRLPALRREFLEFFHYDRNHPSVVLRSLTCETGPSADLGVIRQLYDLCHGEIPGAVVEDDSSWIAWNRVHDFYDDHPYGNNHTWVATLDRLKQHIAQHGVKPLVLGEAIAADTWTPPRRLPTRHRRHPAFWTPRFLKDNVRWLDTMRRLHGATGLSPLEAESKQYALLMRKYQIEAYRREVPYGGYVVSVLRDFPLAAMGLVDYRGKPKWTPQEWSWHGETMLLLETESDRRSVASGSRLDTTIWVSHFGAAPWREAKMTVTLMIGEGTGKGKGRELTGYEQTASLAAGKRNQIVSVGFQMPSVRRPVRVRLIAKLQHESAVVHNEWPIWLVPEAKTETIAGIQLHNSCDHDLASCFPDAARWTGISGRAAPGIVIARRFDRELLEYVENGGRLLMLPDGSRGSLPLRSEWFLRGGPYIPAHRLLKTIPRQLLVELQHFDLAGPVIPEIGYLAEIDPLLLLWANHDLDHVNTHGLVFETRIGKGRLLVSALRHQGRTNAAGRWLLEQFIRHLQGPVAPRRGLSDATIRRMKEQIGRREIDLTRRTWSFRPDPRNEGVSQGWARPEHPVDASWKPIRIGQPWESQGYPQLDGWAWYRTRLSIPQDWPHGPLYVSFNGVDDYYELYVDGTRVGSGGDIAARRTAFNDRTSFDISKFAQPGKTIVIAVRVDDWQGAGGIFRPMSLGTAPLRTNADLLN